MHRPNFPESRGQKNKNRKRGEKENEERHTHMHCHFLKIEFLSLHSPHISIYCYMDFYKNERKKGIETHRRTEKTTDSISLCRSLSKFFLANFHAFWISHQPSCFLIRNSSVYFVPSKPLPLFVIFFSFFFQFFCFQPKKTQRLSS